MKDACISDKDNESMGPGKWRSPPLWMSDVPFIFYTWVLFQIMTLHGPYIIIWVSQAKNTLRGVTVIFVSSRPIGQFRPHSMNRYYIY